MYAEMIEAILNMIETDLELYAAIDVGSMPTDNGIAAYWGPGAPVETYLNKGTHNESYLVVNAKHTSQIEALSALSAIHGYLTRRIMYPRGNNWQILDIRTSTAPNNIGEEQNSQYLYGSILAVKFYLEGVS